MTTRIAGARTPEELETLLEDALLIRDGDALAGLFDEGAILAHNDEHSARGDAIVEFALAHWDGDHGYVAQPQRVIQARDLALIVAERSINVARRGSDGAWRYAIVLVSLDLHLNEMSAQSAQEKS